MINKTEKTAVIVIFVVVISIVVVVVVVVAIKTIILYVQYESIWVHSVRNYSAV